MSPNISNRSELTQFHQKPSKSDCVVYVKCDAFKNRHNGVSPLECAYINTRSCRNKTTSINEFITNNDLDLLIITETWLGTSIDYVIFSQLLPVGYELIHRPRTTGQRGGGASLVYGSNISVKIDNDATPCS